MTQGGLYEAPTQAGLHSTFVERTRRLIRHTIESKHALKLAA